MAATAGSPVRDRVAIPAANPPDNATDQTSSTNGRAYHLRTQSLLYFLMQRWTSLCNVLAPAEATGMPTGVGRVGLRANIHVVQLARVCAGVPSSHARSIFFHRTP